MALHNSSRADFRQLRYFQAVAEDLSFSKAARRLHVAQPAISRTVRDLENQLEVKLFDRTKRSVALTPAGAVLLNETALLFQRLEEAVRRVQRTAAGEEGELRLGYIGPPTQPFLGRIVKEYRKRFPRVTVVMEERTPERVWEMVARGHLAVGLTRPVFASSAQGLRTFLLRREPLCAALPSGHALARHKSISWRALSAEPLVILSRREGVSLHDAVLAACRRARFIPRIAHTPSLISTVLSYVEAGAGIGIVSDSVCSLARGAPIQFRPLTPTHSVDLVLVWSDDNDSPPSAAFRRLLEQWANSGQLWRNSFRQG